VQSKIDNTAEGDAEDIIQDVALRIFSRPEDAVPITNITGFVYHSIRNKIIDVMRTKKLRNDDDSALENLWQDFAELFYSAEERIYSETIKMKLKQALKELRPEYRDIIIAVDFEGYTYREISEETGISSGTLMSRRHRALSILAKKLESNTI